MHKLKDLYKEKSTENSSTFKTERSAVCIKIASWILLEIPVKLLQLFKDQNHFLTRNNRVCSSLYCIVQTASGIHVAANSSVSQ